MVPADRAPTPPPATSLPGMEDDNGPSDDLVVKALQDDDAALLDELSLTHTVALLHRACRHGALACVGHLLRTRCGLDVNAADGQGDTALSLALPHGSQLVGLLLEHGATPAAGVLHAAVSCNTYRQCGFFIPRSLPTTVELLLRHGAVAGWEKDGHTALAVLLCQISCEAKQFSNQRHPYDTSDHQEAVLASAMKLLARAGCDAGGGRHALCVLIDKMARLQNCNLASASAQQGADKDGELAFSVLEAMRLAVTLLTPILEHHCNGQARPACPVLKKAMQKLLGVIESSIQGVAWANLHPNTDIQWFKQLEESFLILLHFGAIVEDLSSLTTLLTARRQTFWSLGCKFINSHRLSDIRQFLHGLPRDDYIKAGDLLRRPRTLKSLSRVAIFCGLQNRRTSKGSLSHLPSRLQNFVFRLDADASEIAIFGALMSEHVAEQWIV